MMQKIKDFFTTASKTVEEKERDTEDLEKEQIKLLEQPTDLAKILKNYRNNKNPGYALLITGAWGVGKTHEITKKYLLPSSIYYVSLFGLKDADQIHSNVFAKMHPVQSFIKNTAKGLEGGELGTEIFTLNLGNILPGVANALIKSDVKKDKIIVFDDFERCSIPINDRLGAINTYVEHNDCRVIVISNDEKIKDDDFSEAKEKLFGITFEIKSDVNDAFEKLSQHYKENKSHQLLIELKEDIIKTIKTGKIYSLRIARHVISDIINLMECLDEKYKNNKESLKHVVKLFTALSCEIRSGNLKINDIKNRSAHEYNILMAGINEKEISAESLNFNNTQEKYQEIGINLTDPTLSNESIENSLIKGLFKSENFKECLEKSFIYKSFEDVPAWKKMLKMDELDDDTTDLIKRDLIKQFNERSVIIPGEMLHLFAFIILMCSIREIDKDLETIKNECIAYIDDLYNSGELISIKISIHENYRLHSSYDGHGYWVADENKAMFSEIFKHLVNMMEQKLIEDHTKNTDKLLDMMINDTDTFIESICHQPYGTGTLAELPIFKNISKENFFDSFLKAPRNKWYYISSALKRRYTNHSFHSYLNSEIDWSITLVDHFEAESNKLTGLKKYRLERVIPHEIKKEALEIKKQKMH